MAAIEGALLGSLRRVALAALLIVLAVCIGFGIPLGWLWVGSTVQTAAGGTGGISMVAALSVLGGIAFSYLVLLWAAGRLGLWLVRRRGEDPPIPHAGWNRSLSEDRVRHDPRHPLERLFVTTSLLVMAAFLIWFALVGHREPPLLGP